MSVEIKEFGLIGANELEGQYYISRYCLVGEPLDLARHQTGNFKWTSEFN
jgi:hypothetical protein